MSTKDWLVQLLPWVPALALGAIGVIKVSKAHKVLIEIRILLNGKEHGDADVSAKERAS